MICQVLHTVWCYISLRLQGKFEIDHSWEWKGCPTQMETPAHRASVSRSNTDHPKKSWACTWKYYLPNTCITCKCQKWNMGAVCYLEEAIEYKYPLGRMICTCSSGWRSQHGISADTRPWCTSWNRRGVCPRTLSWKAREDFASAKGRHRRINQSIAYLCT